MERDRGITIQAQTASMEYEHQGKKYLLNLVDTPGHVDFAYEVERSMRACQGAILLVDANQGIQAQTLSNYYLARKKQLKIIATLNKIDMAQDIDSAELAVKEQLKEDVVSKVSAKTGKGVVDLLKRVIEEVPAPNTEKSTDKLKLFLLNSWYVNNKNVVCLFYVIAGELKKGMTIVSHAFNKGYQIFDLGMLQPEFVSKNKLTPGQIGYTISNMKQVK